MSNAALRAALEAALVHHQMGRLAEAEQIYRQILANEPGHAEAFHGLGILAHQIGRNEAAVDLLERALVQAPGFVQAAFALGVVLEGLGRAGEAVAAYRRAVELQPVHPDAWNNLGNCLLALGRRQEAVEAYRQALGQRVDYPEALCNLGIALLEQGLAGEALEACERAVALRPDFAEAHLNRANALSELGRWQEAVDACQRTISLQPEHAAGFYNLGNALQHLERLEQAAAAYRRAIELKPDYPEAWNNYGTVLLGVGWPAEALEACRRALVLQPALAEAHNNVGNALKALGHPEQAVEAYAQALALRPGYATAHNNLGNALKEQGRVAEAVAAFRRAWELEPGLAEVGSNLLLCLHYCPEVDAATMWQEHQRWAQRHARPAGAAPPVHGQRPEPGRRLRVGYVSSDLRGHPVGRFLLPLLEHHDRREVEVFAYGQVPVPDAQTARLQGLCEHWRSTVGLGDGAVAERVRADRIDILVDLGGHTARNRLLVFAQKPAPVQVNWLGYPDTTGLEAMDYRLTDALADPPGRGGIYCSEQLVRLEPCAWCYPGDDPLPVVARTEGPVVFGSFNAVPKLSEATMRLWAKVMQAVPGSRLLLKGPGPGMAAARERIWGTLEQAGVERGRVELLGHVPGHREHLALYGQVDIALDTFPYCGTTTTCEALWMGVPVVSLAGGSHVSRVGASLLAAAGRREWVAATAEDFVRVAAALAGGRERLAELRAGLRGSLMASPLMDAAGFAREMERAYRWMWMRWCRSRQGG